MWGCRCLPGVKRPVGVWVREGGMWVVGACLVCEETGGSAGEGEQYP